MCDTIIAWSEVKAVKRGAQIRAVGCYVFISLRSGLETNGDICTNGSINIVLSRSFC
jgi:hypothetical protein